MSKRRKSIGNDAVMVRELRADPAYALEYLKAAFDDEQEPAVLMIALRHVAEAYGGVGKLAADAGIRREVLYRALSPNGNPTLKTFLAVIRSLGLKVGIEGPAKAA